MKKISTLLAVALISGSVFAQSQRLTLLEEFTQASCGPCAAQNPALNALLGNNQTKVVSIKYQTSWPGVDPMNAQNPSEVQTRVTYYNVTGVPNIRFDGNVVTGAPSALTQTNINNEYGVASPFTLTVNHVMSSDYDSAYVTVVITCTQNVSGTLKFHLAMVEDTINFTTPPGTNGEKEFFYVMRKMLPNASGTTLATSWTNGQTQTINFAVPIPAYIYSKSAIAFVGFIQDDANKNVKQAGYSPAQPLAIDAGVSSAAVNFLNCSTTINPTVYVKNYGTTTLTSCTVNYKIDNNTVQTFNWTGSLAPNMSTLVTLPSMTTTAGNHTFTAYTSNPNNMTDYDAGNDQKVQAFAVTGSSVLTPLVEGMQVAQFPPANWLRHNVNGDAVQWARVTTCGGFGNSTASAKMDFYNSPTGNVDILYTPPIDMSSLTTADLKFNVAYAPYSAQYADTLKIMVSTNCGQTWTTVYNKFNTTLSTANATTAAFTPTANQWRAETVSLNAFAGQNGVIVRFHAGSGYGNNLYLDDINISAPSGIIDLFNTLEVAVYPNPTNGNLVVFVNMEQTSDVTITVTNVLGEQVFVQNKTGVSAGANNIAMDLSSLNNGVYFVNVLAGKNVATQKITINK